MFPDFALSMFICPRIKILFLKIHGRKLSHKAALELTWFCCYLIFHYSIKVLPTNLSLIIQIYNKPFFLLFAVMFALGICLSSFGGLFSFNTLVLSIVNHSSHLKHDGEVSCFVLLLCMPLFCHNA